VWYAFQIVQVFTPPILLFAVQDTVREYDNEEDAGGMSYKSLMFVLWALHVFQFIFNNRIYLREVPASYKSEQNTQTSVNDEEDAANDETVSNVDDTQAKDTKEYIELDKTFNNKYWWVWIVNTIGYFVVLIPYCLYAGHERLYNLWIPLDVFMFIGMAVFWMFNKFQSDKR